MKEYRHQHGEYQSIEMQQQPLQRSWGDSVSATHRCEDDERVSSLVPAPQLMSLGPVTKVWTRIAGDSLVVLAAVRSRH
ncbi:hypothetical protein PLESTB_000110800 [Pleodorina starrii]|uniref:Uncharacterized protein n=1 Tax=Pleodorina starrii TaxID=330485 RepID=A0A9W6EXS5_9CHLO|nr:hypothetical protein PLESTB_000110800 [Pleodorina starrii]